MIRFIFFTFFLCLSQFAWSQDKPIGEVIDENVLVKEACMDYIEGFYEGDEEKLKRSVKPTLHKFGFWKLEGEDAYESTGQLTFEKALELARSIKEKKEFADEDAMKKVEVLDIMENIASAKVSATWGYDYILLSKEGEKWMIEQVLWQGPLKNK